MDKWMHLKMKKIKEINFFSKLWYLCSTFTLHNCPENWAKEPIFAIKRALWENFSTSPNYLMYWWYLAKLCRKKTEYNAKVQWVHGNPKFQMQLQQHCFKTVSAIFCLGFFFVRDIQYKHFKPMGNPTACLLSFCRNRNGVNINDFKQQVIASSNS